MDTRKKKKKHKRERNRIEELSRGDEFDNLLEIQEVSDDVSTHSLDECNTVVGKLLQIQRYDRLVQYRWDFFIGQERNGKTFETIVSCAEFLLTVLCIPCHCCLFPCYRNNELFADIITATSAVCCIVPCCPIICMYKVCCGSVTTVDIVAPDSSNETIENSLKSSS